MSRLRFVLVGTFLCAVGAAVVAVSVLPENRGSTSTEAGAERALPMEDDEVPLTGNALGNRLQAPPASGLPNGWVRHDTLQVVVPQPREPQDNTSNPEVIHVDDVDDWFAEEAEQAKGLEPQEGITASLFFYAPAGPVDRPESYVLSRKPFIATAVFPSGASAGFVDQMTAAGLSVRTFKNTSEDVLVLSAALVADSDVDRYVETVLGVRGTR